MEIKQLVNTILLSISIIEGLKSNDICFKRHECKEGNKCTTSNCKGLLSFNCNRLECTLDAVKCDEYHLILKEISNKRYLKLEKAATVSLIQGITYVTKRLKGYVKILKNIKMCL